jgi:RNA polymerase sigma factor (sigma-70 family)
MAERHDIVSNPYAQSLIRIKASQLCRRADFNRSDLEDLHQEMRAHLLMVAHHFDPERASLRTFIAHAIESCVRMILRGRWRDKRRVDRASVSLEGTEIASEKQRVPLWSVLRSDDQTRRTRNAGYDPIEEFDRRDAFAHVFNQLSDQQRELVVQVMEHRKAGAARVLGTSRRQVDKELQAMRQLFIDAGLAGD